MLNDRYPNMPGHRGVDTSVAAADGIAYSVGRLQRVVLCAIADAGPAGRSTNELADQLALDRASIQPRTSELRSKRLIADSGQRRRNANGKRAIEWVISAIAPKTQEARDALSRGVDGYGLHPDELAMQVVNQSPEHLGQMQLGYRGAMVDHASRVRDSGNPWDATLGSPVARDRLQTVYPDNPGVDRMLRMLDVEKRLAQTTNAVLGNSRTARNQIADQAFGSSPLIEGALHAGAAVATNGASVPGTAARLVGSGLKDRFALGLGKRAEAKADAIAPVLLNPDPNAAISKVLDMLTQQRAFQEFVARTKPKGLGMFGRALGSQAAVAPVNQ